MKTLAAALLSLTISLSAAAQTETRGTTLYRCGAEGRDLRDAPCPAGMAQKSAQVQYAQPSSAQPTIVAGHHPIGGKLLQTTTPPAMAAPNRPTWRQAAARQPVTARWASPARSWRAVL